MLPRYRNLAIARDHAEKLATGTQSETAFLYTKNTEEIEDPENTFGTADLSGLKKKMVSFLYGYGYPSVPLQRKDTATIDAGLAALLYDHLLEKECLPKSSEASDIKTWSFFNICLIPEIIGWRFKKGDTINIERFIGTRRNYSGYLWLAAWLFCDRNSKDNWYVLKNMSVDSIVQVIERPGVGYNKVFALELGKQMVENGKAHKTNETNLVRGAMLRARFTGAVIKQTFDNEINKNLVGHLISWSKKFYLDQGESK